MHDNTLFYPTVDLDSPLIFPSKGTLCSETDLYSSLISLVVDIHAL